MVGRTGLRLSPCERVLLDCAARDAILTAGVLSLVEHVRDVATVRAGGAR